MSARRYSPHRRVLGTDRSLVAGVALLSVAVALSGCKGGSNEDSPAASGQPAESAPSAAPSAPKPAASGVAAPVATGNRMPAAAIEAQVNSSRRPAFSGPTGSIRGRIIAKGDPSPVAADVLKTVPADCLGAKETFGHLFREGMNRSLADVLVAVTGFDGYVPARGDAVTVEARGCAWDTRTVALTFGQRIDVVSKDMGTYVPELLGQKSAAQLFATPGGSPVELFPMQPGQYVLVDSVRLFNAAEVYVLRYATFDVTGLDGKYEIAGIPPGKVKLSAMLPITRGIAQQDVTIEAGKALEVDLEIAFDQKAYEAKLAEDKARSKQAPAPSAAPSGATSAAPKAPAPAKAAPKQPEPGK